MRIKNKVVTIDKEYAVNGYTALRLHKLLQDATQTIMEGATMTADEAHLMYEEVQTLFDRFVELN